MRTRALWVRSCGKHILDIKKKTKQTHIVYQQPSRLKYWVYGRNSCTYLSCWRMNVTGSRKTSWSIYQQLSQILCSGMTELTAWILDLHSSGTNKTFLCLLNVLIGNSFLTFQPQQPHKGRKCHTHSIKCTLVFCLCAGKPTLSFYFLRWRLTWCCVEWGESAMASHWLGESSPHCSHNMKPAEKHQNNSSELSLQSLPRSQEKTSFWFLYVKDELI